MKKLFKVTFLSGLLTLVKMGSGFIIAKVVAVYTGPTGMAMLGQIQSLVGALNGIVAAPVGNGVVCYTAKNHQQGYEACAPWWRASMQWLLGLCMIILPVVFIFANQLSAILLNSEEYSWIIIAIALALPLSAASTLITSVINGQEQYRRYMYLGMVSVIAATVVMSCIIVVYNVNGALLSVGLYLAFAGLVMLVGSFRQPWFKFKFWIGKTKYKHLKGVGGYVLMAVITAMLSPVSQIIIRKILVIEVGWKQAGLWQAVWKISEVYLGVITMALGTYYLPVLSRLKTYDSVRKEIYDSLKIILPAVSILSLIIYLFRDLAITLLFTEEFRASRDLFSIQLAGDVIKISSWMFAYTMLSHGAVLWFVVSEVVFSITYVFLAWLFIGYYGTQGANIAYSLNYVFYLMFLSINHKNIVNCD